MIQPRRPIPSVAIPAANRTIIPLRSSDGFKWDVTAGRKMTIRYQATLKDWTQSATRVAATGAPEKYVEFTGEARRGRGAAGKDGGQVGADGIWRGRGPPAGFCGR